MKKFFEIYKKLKLCLIFFVVLVSKTKKTTNNFKRDHHSRPDFMINDKEFVGIFTMCVCVCVWIQFGNKFTIVRTKQF